MLGVGQRVVFLEGQVVVVVVLAGEKLKPDAGLPIPAVDVKLDAVLSEHHVPLDRIAAAAEEPGQQGAALKFTECFRHTPVVFLAAVSN